MTKQITIDPYVALHETKLELQFCNDRKLVLANEVQSLLRQVDELTNRVAELEGAQNGDQT